MISLRQKATFRDNNKVRDSNVDEVVTTKRNSCVRLCNVNNNKNHTSDTTQIS